MEVLISSQTLFDLQNGKSFSSLERMAQFRYLVNDCAAKALNAEAE
jgi:hypothetical protein